MCISATVRDKKQRQITLRGPVYEETGGDGDGNVGRMESKTEKLKASRDVKSRQPSIGLVCG